MDKVDREQILIKLLADSNESNYYGASYRAVEERARLKSRKSVPTILAALRKNYQGARYYGADSQNPQWQISNMCIFALIN
jgi:hypothetical protein